jgi:Domain of unknown function (DUF1707)
MVPVFEDHAVSWPPDGVNEADRVAAIGRLHELVRGGTLSLERFSAVLEQVLAAVSYADLEAAMLVLPPLIRLTSASRRLAQPLVLEADGGLKLGSGWQLAADTTIRVAFGTAWVDLTAASWDANQINLRLETRAGAFEVIIPEGVAVQMVGGSGRVQLESLSAPLPAGPVLRISTLGPTGVIRIRHPKKGKAGPLTRWRRRSSPGKPSSGK